MQNDTQASDIPMPEDFPDQYRPLFPVTERYVYMNHASVAPVSTRVRNAMVWALDANMNHAPRSWEELEGRQHSARCAAARLVNAQPHQIAFLRNTSEGLSVIANGLDWRAGENVVAAEIEFPANLYPWLRVAAEYGVEARLQAAQENRVEIDDLLALCDQRTRVVTVSWVQFGTGQRLDIRRIGEFCRSRGILFVVDVVQGLGALELDVERDMVDAFAGGAQKFLLGPKGTGLLYLSDRAVEQIRPTVIGWTAVKDSGDYRRHELDFREGAIRFEGGTLNNVGICGVGAAIELFLEAGPSRIERHLLGLSKHLTESLVERGYQVLGAAHQTDASAIIVCRHNRLSAEEVWAGLDSRNIITSARLGWLRIAPHFYNTRAEVDALIDALPL